MPSTNVVLLRIELTQFFKKAGMNDKTIPTPIMKTSAPPTFTDRPDRFSRTQVNGDVLKPLTQVLLERRATAHFKSEPVPQEYLDAILQFTLQSPSGFNLQPWRFIVVRDETNRQRLKKVAMNQAKVGEVPVVVIAFAIPGEWKQLLFVGIEGWYNQRGRHSALGYQSPVAFEAQFMNN
jgi:hypothetical protein